MCYNGGRNFYIGYCVHLWALLLIVSTNLTVVSYLKTMTWIDGHAQPLTSRAARCPNKPFHLILGFRPFSTQRNKDQWTLLGRCLTVPRFAGVRTVKTT
jgi:hypothetical protein